MLFENIDVVNSLEDDDNQTVGYRVAIQRVKRLCKIDLRHYENNLVELGRVRNQIQHYKCVINGAYHKELMARAFSSIEFLFLGFDLKPMRISLTGQILNFCTKMLLRMKLEKQT